ncbi:MAG: hypothetical protein RL375_4907, partial [Pseudomonadota bacterium]
MASRAATFKADRQTVRMMAALEGFKLAPGELSHAAAKAGNIVAERARAAAPVGPTGRLKRNIYAMIIAPGRALIGAKYGAGKAPHAHLVEYGTQQRQFRKGPHKATIGGRVVTVRHAGRMPASGFFKRALAASKALVDRFLLDDF